jgi:hypothetical protein
VTYLDPAGFITRENGCDMRDATAYKFNKYKMLVSEISSQVSWSGNVRNIDTYKTYKYDIGNDVKIVERQSQTFYFYKSDGSMDDKVKGSNIDVKV